MSLYSSPTTTMAPTLSHVIRAISHDAVFEHDAVFDVNGVSGFYGPGAWSAWFLILVTSWVATIRGDYSHNIHHIGYLLYTNWAAVDLIRQATKPLINSTDTTRGQPPLNASLAAAL
jgi:hypothetical protein